MPMAPQEASGSLFGKPLVGQWLAQPRRAWEGNTSPAKGAGPHGRD